MSEAEVLSQNFNTVDIEGKENLEQQNLSPLLQERASPPLKAAHQEEEEELCEAATNDIEDGEIVSIYEPNQVIRSETATLVSSPPVYRTLTSPHSSTKEGDPSSYTTPSEMIQQPRQQHLLDRASPTNDTFEEEEKNCEITEEGIVDYKLRSSSYTIMKHFQTASQNGSCTDDDEGAGEETMANGTREGSFVIDRNNSNRNIVANGGVVQDSSCEDFQDAVDNNEADAASSPVIQSPPPNEGESVLRSSSYTVITDRSSSSEQQSVLSGNNQHPSPSAEMLKKELMNEKLLSRSGGNSSVKKSMDEKDQLIIELKAEIDRYRREDALRNVEVAASGDMKTSANDSLVKMVMAVTSNYRELTAINDGLVEDVRGLEASLSYAIRRHTNLKAAHTNLSSENDALIRENQTLKEQLNKSKEKYVVLKNYAEKNITAKVKQSEEDRRSADMRVMRAEAQLERIEHRANNLEQMLQIKSTELTDLNRLYDEMVAKKFDQK